MKNPIIKYRMGTWYCLLAFMLAIIAAPASAQSDQQPQETSVHGALVYITMQSGAIASDIASQEQIFSDAKGDYFLGHEVSEVRLLPTASVGLHNCDYVIIGAGFEVSPGANLHVFIDDCGENNFVVDGSEAVSSQISDQTYGVNTIGTLKVYPNPFDEVAHLEIRALQNARIKVSLRDITGRELGASQMEYDVIEGINTLDIHGENLPAGIYLLTVDGLGESSATRIIKNK